MREKKTQFESYMTTRSRSHLPGSVRDYLLGDRMPSQNPTDEVHPEGEGSPSNIGSRQQGDVRHQQQQQGVQQQSDQEQLAALLGRMAGDPSQICAILAQSLSTVTETNRHLQKRQIKLEDCPKKRKYCTLEAWTEEVTLWDENNEIPESENAKKYLKFIEVVQNSEEADEWEHTE